MNAVFAVFTMPARLRLAVVNDCLPHVLSCIEYIEHPLA